MVKHSFPVHMFFGGVCRANAPITVRVEEFLNVGRGKVRFSCSVILR